MESQLVRWNSDLKPGHPLGFFTLLRVSFKTFKTNRKLILPLLLLVFLSFLMLEIAQIYLLKPVARSISTPLAEKYAKFVEDNLPNNTQHTPQPHDQPDVNYASVFNDLFEFLMTKLIMLTFSSIISLVFLLAAVSSLSEAYPSQVQNKTEMIKKIKQSWKKPILTSFYMIFINMGSIFLSLFSFVVASFLSIYLWKYLLDGAVFLLAVIWIYVITLWMMSLVVSIIEDAVAGGLDSIIRARELMKGKKIKASLLMGLLVVGYGLVDWMIDAILIKNLDKWSRTVISVVFSNGLLCGLQVSVFVVFTVFYHEQKASWDQKAVKSH